MDCEETFLENYNDARKNLSDVKREHRRQPYDSHLWKILSDRRQQQLYPE